MGPQRSDGDLPTGPIGRRVGQDNVAAGVGDTVPAMGIEIVGTTLRIPIALGLVALGVGYASVWWAVAVTIVFKAIAFEVWFRLGRWAEPGDRF